MLQLIYTRFRDIEDQRTIEFLGKVKNGIRRPERFEKQYIDANNNIYAFGYSGAVGGKKYYKYFRFNGYLVEAIEFVRQRILDNSMVQLIDDSYGKVYKIFKNNKGEWKVLIMLIRGSQFSEQTSISIDKLFCQCIAIKIGDQIH